MSWLEGSQIREDEHACDQPQAEWRRFTLGTFFFDLPDAVEREAIWKVYLAKSQFSDAAREHPNDEGWTGAEIKECCRKAWP